MRLRFLSSNPRKTGEVCEILRAQGLEIIPVERKLDEIQSQDVELLVRDKCIKAFRIIGRPVFVEHTGLFIEALNGFPGGLTQIFWDTLGPERVAAVFGSNGASRVIARTRIGYCDGRRVHQFEGEVSGRFAGEPQARAAGDEPLEWDSLFIPDGEEETFAEMGPRKNEVSMRRRALDAFSQFLKGARHGG